ncbi:unnamed protein product [Rotaria sordida]|uniref:PI3K/PI4K catalytic domain-containing protein n=1 Tax=Rotaria sordida TaxID=392033 RepID=A0A815JTG3_9BILA|nr:unnamed protein product [Rotaria sordida]CAF3972436.1 unnamed protein product [Rotaria sordida]
MIKILEPLPAAIERGSATIDERKFLDSYATVQNQLIQAWHLYYQLFTCIRTQLASITSLELEHVFPRLIINCQNLELAVLVITSKQRPRKISIKDSDGYEYVFLLKGYEDLRQDERVMQLFGLVSEFQLTNDETRRRNFTIQRYPVIPLALNNGLLSWVAQCNTMYALIKEHREKAPHYDRLPLLNKVKIF